MCNTMYMLGTNTSQNYVKIFYVDLLISSRNYFNFSLRVWGYVVSCTQVQTATYSWEIVALSVYNAPL